MAKGEARYDSYTLASRALKRALDDAGLKKDDIDGLCTGPTLSGERASELWGLNPRWSGSGDAAQCIIEAAMAIHCGLCTTVALVYGNAQRSMDTAYGGARVTGGGITSYFYYAPWGLTSQGALYALFFQRHKLLYGTTEEQLGAIAVAFRKHACLNANAVMYGKPITIDDYMNAKYVAEPLRLYDYCLINDGGVALIVRRADMAQDLKHKPVMVSGFGWSEDNVDATQLRPRLKDFYHTAHHGVAQQIYPMAGVTPKDVDVLPPTTASVCICSPRSKVSAFAKRARAAPSCRTAASKSAASCRATPAAACSPRAICKAGTTSPNWCASCAGA
jgi:acetyl-CoA acetyltransferase